MQGATLLLGGVSKPASIGLPLPSTDVSIRDDQGAEVPLGGPFAQLRIRGGRARYHHDEIEPDGAVATSFFTRGAIFTVMVPATTITSACRGVARTMVPIRSRSTRLSSKPLLSAIAACTRLSVRVPWST